ncbi:MAG TPA: hypothetical protein VGM83_14390 [Devosiaceae bacterium]|jgi:hypothetical protein
MAFIDTAHIGTHHNPFSLVDPNRSDILGAAISTVLPVAAFIICHGALGDPVPAGVHVGAGGWLGFVVPAIILPLWGLSRWQASQAGSEGQTVSWMLVALIAAVITYPYISVHVSLLMAVFLNFLLLVLAVGVAMRAQKVCQPAFLSMLPGVIWIGVVCLFGLAIVAAWSPPFALSSQPGSSDGSPTAA